MIELSTSYVELAVGRNERSSPSWVQWPRCGRSLQITVQAVRRRALSGTLHYHLLQYASIFTLQYYTA